MTSSTRSYIPHKLQEFNMFKFFTDNIFTSILNTSGRLEESVPDYLNVVVLQRHGLTSPENAFGHLKFQLTFNLAVVWMIVFVSLSKGEIGFFYPSPIFGLKQSESLR